MVIVYFHLLYFFHALLTLTYIKTHEFHTVNSDARWTCRIMKKKQGEECVRNMQKWLESDSGARN